MASQGSPHSQVARILGKYLRSDGFKASICFLFLAVVMHLNLSQGFYCSKSCPVCINSSQLILSLQEGMLWRPKSLKLPLREPKSSQTCTFDIIILDNTVFSHFLITKEIKMCKRGQGVREIQV